MKATLQFKLNNQLAMTPQLQQAIRLLQLSSLELDAEIKTILESNFLLEQLEPDDENTLQNEDFFTEELNFLDDYTNQLSVTHGSTQESDLPQKNPETTLQQYCLWQMEMAHFSLTERAIGIALIDALTDEGYLQCSLEDIQQSLNQSVSLAEIEAVLHQIQKFDPLGVGARNLSECLLIQLNGKPNDTPFIQEAKWLASEYLEILGSHDFAILQKKLKMDAETIHKAFSLLKSLNPKPGNRVSSKKSEYIIPDLIAYKKNNQILIKLNKDFIPKIRLNTNYINLLKNSEDNANQSSYKILLKEAKWFLKGLRNRYETLLKTAQCVLEEQIDFFDEGEAKMRPLNLQNVAQKIHLHESTISRVTTQKYVLTPRGVFELKYFFSNSAALQAGASISATAIRSQIKELIAKESSQAPLSDHKIMELLAKQGVTIARRTVTKYRESMGIPASSGRRYHRFS